MITRLTVLLLLAVAAVGASGQTALEDWVKEGEGLTPPEFEALERKITSNPDDPELRSKMLGYFWRNRPEEAAEKELQVETILWMIRNYPATAAAAPPYVAMDPVVADEKLSEARQLWREKIEAFNEEPSVVANAVEFLALNDRIAAEALLGELTRIEPDPVWQERLGHLYQLSAAFPVPEERLEQVQEWLETFEEVYEEVEEEEKKFFLLDDMATLAFAAGEGLKARNYAYKLLDVASHHRNHPNYPVALHNAHTTLGRIELMAGNVSEAGAHLAASGMVEPSLRLRLIGPRFDLAQELLAAGEQEMVVGYLESVRRFWKRGEAQLTRWIEQIKELGVARMKE